MMAKMIRMIIIHLQCGIPEFNFWIRKIPWKREWKPTPVFLPGEFHEQGSLGAIVSGVAKNRTQLSY